jgi:hypothetical protein
MSSPAFLYWCQSRVTTQKDERETQVAKVNSLHPHPLHPGVTRCNELDASRKVDIRNELRVCGWKWFQHVQ